MSEVRSGRPLGRLVTEMIVIVASILLAFWIEAAWEERSDRTRERQALGDLQADFLESRKQLQDGIELGRIRITSLEALGAVATSRIPAPSRDSINILLGQILWVNSMDPVTSTLDYLKGSGELGILRSERLRILLAGWESDVRDTKEDEAVLAHSTFSDL